MTLGAGLRIQASLRRLHAYHLGCSAILLYHRIADEAVDPWGLCVSPVQFWDQLTALRRSGYTLVSLREAVEEKRPRCRRVVLTFDDGYLDNLDAALPILEAHSCPATFFVTAGAIGNLPAFWWDELEALIFTPSRLPNRLRIPLEGIEDLEFNIEDESSNSQFLESSPWDARHHRPTERDSLYTYLYSRLAQTPALRPTALRNCWAWAGLDPESMPRLVMNNDELLALSRNSGVEIGSHGWSHERLPALDDASRRHEIFASRERLQAITGACVSAFSYPHGAYSSETSELTQAAGYRYVCNSAQALVKPSTEHVALPRISVGNWSGQQLVDALRRYF